MGVGTLFRGAGGWKSLEGKSGSDVVIYMEVQPLELSLQALIQPFIGFQCPLVP